MRLTVFTDYTLRTLLYLALHPRKLARISDIADAYGISANHLMKVVYQLAQAGDIVTLRGQHGGLRLARPAAEINLGVVIRRTEPDMELAPCFRSGSCCVIQAQCGISRALGEALQAFLGVLDRYTIADLLAGRHAPLANLLGVSEPSCPDTAA